MIINDGMMEGILSYEEYKQFCIDQFNKKLFESIEQLRWYPITDDPGIIGLNVIKFTDQPIDYQI